MTITELLAKSDIPLRRILTQLSPQLSVFFYSYVRKIFLKLLAAENIPERRIMPDEFRKVLWDIDFSVPLFNSAGMFKTGDGYQTVARQGAGAFLAGTTTKGGRKGNFKNNILHPFISLPRSAIALNWMGLPNPGHNAVAKKLAGIDKISGCPLGASISADPEASEADGLQGLLLGLQQYDRAGVDFIEINESCPNVPSHHSKQHDNLDEGFIKRMEYVSEHFLSKRNRRLPLIVKFSVDTANTNIPLILDLLFDLGFDGINIGNTSVQYSEIQGEVNPQEKKLFDYFTQTYGGGVSGTVLKDKSLRSCTIAAEYLNKNQPKQEFHIIRTGGVENTNDVRESLENGISLCQWFTGYFDSFIKYGHDIYKEIFIDNYEL